MFVGAYPEHRSPFWHRGRNVEGTIRRIAVRIQPPVGRRSTNLFFWGFGLFYRGVEIRGLAFTANIVPSHQDEDCLCQPPVNFFRRGAEIVCVGLGLARVRSRNYRQRVGRR